MPDDDRPLVVVVDDDPLISRTLGELLETEFRVHAVTSPEAALHVLDESQVAVMLADQRMPGMGGVELLAEARARQPDIVGVLITGHADIASAVRAINSARVLGFLTKPWDEQELFTVMHRAIDAHHALQQLLRASAATEREVKVLERLISAPVPMTAQRFGRGPLRSALPDEFANLANDYGAILGNALEERVYKIDHQISEALRNLASRLGALNAGPRDVVDIHVTALKVRLESTAPRAATELVDASRLLVLELMGELVSYYRAITLGARV
jgi:FixJ family two-component response regulator